MNNTIFLIPQVIVAALLILVILLQVKESGGGIFGGATGTPRTRRGFEKRLFQFTIGLSIVFIVLATLSARFSY